LFRRIFTTKICSGILETSQDKKRNEIEASTARNTNIKHFWNFRSKHRKLFERDFIFEKNKKFETQSTKKTNSERETKQFHFNHKQKETKTTTDGLKKTKKTEKNFERR
jgi:hypothetical protein